MRLERVHRIRNGPAPPELEKLRHLQSLVSARIDALEGFEVEFHVHGQAVIAGMATNADTDAAQFLAGHVDAGRFLTGLSTDPEFGRQLNHALLECRDDIADA